MGSFYVQSAPEGVWAYEKRRKGRREFMFTLFVNILKTTASRRKVGENVACKKEFILKIFWP
jgi:DNA-dependent RNA polymerase auxiliary subunit epsilon